MVRQGQRQLGILLDQQHADACPGRSGQDLEISPDHGDETRRRGLVEQQKARRQISARAIASICCSPPESVPACWRRRSASTGK